MLERLPDGFVVDFEVAVHEDIAHARRIGKAVCRAGVEPIRTKGFEDSAVIGGHLRSQLRDQVGADVDPNLDRELDSMLSREASTEVGAVGVAATGAEVVELFQQLSEPVEPGLNALGVDQSAPRAVARPDTAAAARYRGAGFA